MQQNALEPEELFILADLKQICDASLDSNESSERLQESKSSSELDSVVFSVNADR